MFIIGKKILSDSIYNNHEKLSQSAKINHNPHWPYII